MSGSQRGGRCFGYVRVSTVKQGQQGVSLEAQREAIERYAQCNGLDIVEWFTETQTAAKRGRKEYDRMLRLLRKSRADGVVIHKIDRGARNLRDWADLGELVDRGIVIHLASESLDLTSRGGRLSADIQAVVAADFIRNLREETKKGFYGRLKQGLYPTRAPLGYLDNGRGKPKTVDPAKGPLVRELFERYATGRYTLQAICVAMENAGLRNRVGKPLEKNGTSRILNNPFYTGLIEISTTGEVFEGVHERLISKALYDRVQRVLHGRVGEKQHRHEFTYRRLLACGLCAGTMIGEHQKGHTYYRCHTKACPTTCMREERIEETVAGALARIALTPEEREECYGALAWLDGQSETLAEDTLERLRLEEAKVTDRLSRLTDLLIDGVLDREAYEEKKRVLLEQRLSLKDQIRRYEENASWVAESVREVLELAEGPLLSYEMAEPAEKREMVEILTSNRRVSGKEVAVELRKPFWLLANRHAVPHGDPSRDVPRTSALASTAKSTSTIPDAWSPLQRMVAELWNHFERVRAAANGRL